MFWGSICESDHHEHHSLHTIYVPSTLWSTCCSFNLAYDVSIHIWTTLSVHQGKQTYMQMRQGDNHGIWYTKIVNCLLYAWSIGRHINTKFHSNFLCTSRFYGSRFITRGFLYHQNTDPAGTRFWEPRALRSTKTSQTHPFWNLHMLNIIVWITSCRLYIIIKLSYSELAVAVCP